MKTNSIINKNGWLTNEAIISLRSQIVLNSLFLHDYENSFGLDCDEVCNFFDSFISFISELMQEDGINDDEFWDNIEKYDNNENLIMWYECYEFNPFNTNSIVNENVA